VFGIRFTDCLVHFRVSPFSSSGSVVSNELIGRLQSEAGI
jgi:hypothetical protein